MNDVYKAKLVSLARSIERFQGLEQKEEEWLRPLLSKGFETTLDILDLISLRPMTFAEIAYELELNPMTVSQKLNALLIGGYSALSLNDKTAFAEVGRPRKLARQAS